MQLETLMQFVTIETTDIKTQRYPHRQRQRAPYGILEHLISQPTGEPDGYGLSHTPLVLRIKRV